MGPPSGPSRRSLPLLMRTRGRFLRSVPLHDLKNSVGPRTWVRVPMSQPAEVGRNSLLRETWSIIVHVMMCMAVSFAVTCLLWLAVSPWARGKSISKVDHGPDLMIPPLKSQPLGGAISRGSASANRCLSFGRSAMGIAPLRGTQGFWGNNRWGDCDG